MLIINRTLSSVAATVIFIVNVLGVNRSKINLRNDPICFLNARVFKFRFALMNIHLFNSALKLNYIYQL